MSEDVNNVRGFFADVCETDPFSGGCIVPRMGWFEGMGFMGFYGEGVV
jgi:hypothetical protein